MEKQNKDSQISIKLSENEKQLFNSKAEALGLTISQLFRRMLEAPNVGTYDVLIKLNKKQYDVLDKVYGDFMLQFADWPEEYEKNPDLGFNILEVLKQLPCLDYIDSPSEGMFDGKDFNYWWPIIGRVFPDTKKESED